MRFAGLTICLVLAVVSSGCRVGLVAEAPENKNVIEGSNEPVAGPTGSAGGANGGIPPTGDILAGFVPAAERNLQVVADSGSVVSKSASFTTLVSIDWVAGGTSSGTSTKSIPLRIVAGQEEMKSKSGGTP